MTPTIQMRGTIHGQTIELEQPISIGEGVLVEVTISRVGLAEHEILPPGEGIRRSFGAWADDAEELDAYLEWNRQQRKHSRPEIEP